MFQPIIAGSEVGRGYSELNDPIDQDNRFKSQEKLLKGGDEEAMMSDHEFVEMLEHGMPPACGWATASASLPYSPTKLFAKHRCFL